MSVIESKAAEVATHMTSESNIPNKVAFDPMTIMAIIGVIVQLVQQVMACINKPKDAADRARQPRLLDHWRVRRLVRQYNWQHPELAKDPNVVADAIVHTGRKVSDVEMEGMYAEGLKKQEGK